MDVSDGPRVAIVGAGFAGIWAAKTLEGRRVRVTLIDRNNFHSFFPLLYQVAAAELAPGDIAYPIRAMVRRMSNVEFVLGTVVGLDTQERNVKLADGSRLPYDHLILAPGSSTQYFGVAGADLHARPLRTLDDAIELRNHILRTSERSQRLDGSESQAARTFVIVGGGPTGVEFAGALSELIRGPLRKELPDLSGVQVVLLEGADHLLGVYPDSLRAYAQARLHKMGIDVRLGAQVADVMRDRVVLSDGTEIATDTVVWTAGVGGPPDLKTWGLDTLRNGTVAVDRYLRVDGDPSVYLVGDCARPGDIFAPMVAQNAQQQGVLAARNILRSVSGEPPEAYEYRDLGNMAVIGRNAAVVHLFNRWRFKGFVAWVMWLTLHLMKLVGFRNRVSALLSWSGDYLFGDRVARLIVPPDTDQASGS